jgi:hypothetical protein
MTLTRNESRIGEVWGRLIGCFGGDAVERKYGKTVPPEWIAMISRLSDPQVDRGLRRLIYGGKAHVPTLPEFVKLCRAVGGEEFDEPTSTVTALPAPDDRFDEWDMAGNRHLWNCIFAQMKTRKFSETETRILVGFKNAWARDMREGNLDAATGEIKPPTIDEQKAAWADCMQRAEQAIAQKVAA